MFKKAVGIFLLTAFGSLLGIAIYTSFFEKERVYIQKERFQPVFSNHVPDNNSSLKDLPNFVGAVQHVRPAVVHIRARYDSRPSRNSGDIFSNPFKDFFDEDRRGFDNQSMASGSGVIISSDGYIATNNHVIEQAEKVEVNLFDNRSYEAKVIGVDVNTDLALLKIQETNLPFLNFGNSDLVQVGEWVLAVGNPMDLNSTVTAGIVSAKGRNLNLLQESNVAIESFIQTDAAVNKGNSGGALVNTSGELIGINTAIASRTGYYAGYSFAIPATIARKVMEDLLTYGEVKRGFLGVRIQPVNALVAKRYGLHILKGAYVADVDPKLGASEAGIRQGDVIVSVNDMEVNNSSQLQEQVSRYRPGERISIKVFRGKKEIDFDVQLKTLEGNLTFSQDRTRLNFRGNTFRLLSEEEAKKYEVVPGIIIDEVSRELRKKGIKPGFMITNLNDVKISSINDLENGFVVAEEGVVLKGFYLKSGRSAIYELSW